MFGKVTDVLALITYWLKVKMLMMAFLSVNAFVFLVPMMPELVAMAKVSLPDGKVSQEFLDKTHTEQLVGMSNVIPLIIELGCWVLLNPSFGKNENNYHQVP